MIKEKSLSHEVFSSYFCVAVYTHIMIFLRNVRFVVLASRYCCNMIHHRCRLHR